MILESFSLPHFFFVIKFSLLTGSSIETFFFHLFEFIGFPFLRIKAALISKVDFSVSVGIILVDSNVDVDVDDDDDDDDNDDDTSGTDGTLGNYEYLLIPNLFNTSESESESVSALNTSVNDLTTEFLSGF